MKAITLYPLWALLIALEKKRYETRSWQSGYRGPLAITASARLSDDDRACFDQEPFFTVCKEAGFPRIEDLPRGGVVCTALVTEIQPCTDVVRHLSELERAFGFYDAGRFAWKLEGIERCEPVIPCKGSRMLWDLNLKEARREMTERSAPKFRHQGDLFAV